MSKDTIYREDAIKALIEWYGCKPDGIEAFEEIIKAIPSADNEVVGKLKTAIESEELCKNCPTAERISSENLLGAMALGFSYGTNADRHQGKWVPCSERFPEEEGIYLVTATNYIFDTEEIAVGTCYFNIEHGFSNNKKILAWMPLPKPWKGVSNV